MSERVEAESETAPSDADEEIGAPGLIHHFGPIVRDVIRVTAIVGGFGIALVVVHKGMGFFADPTLGLDSIPASLLAIFD